MPTWQAARCRRSAGRPRGQHPCGSSCSVPPAPQVGDWGRGPGQEGHDNQTAVSQLMDKVASAQPVEFIVSTGDNFYPNGLVSYNDSAFTDTFTKAYAAKSLQARQGDGRGAGAARVLTATRCACGRPGSCCCLKTCGSKHALLCVLPRLLLRPTC